MPSKGTPIITSADLRRAVISFLWKAAIAAALIIAIGTILTGCVPAERCPTSPRCVTEITPRPGPIAMPAVGFTW